MNYLQLCQQLVEDAGIAGSFTTTAGTTGEFSRVTNWIKRAVTEIEGLWFDWDFLYVDGPTNPVSMVIGQNDYPPGSLVNMWDKDAFIRTAQNSVLEYWLWERVKNQPELVTNGDPYAFTILPNKSIRIYGTPTAVESIQMPYWLKPTVLTDDVDVPLIPEQFHDIVVYKALEYYANYESAEEVKLQAVEGYRARLRQLESFACPARQEHGNRNTGIDIQILAEGSNYGY